MSGPDEVTPDAPGVVYESVTLLEQQGKRGISTAMWYLNRENIQGFNVREFYVKLVADLKCQRY